MQHILKQKLKRYFRKEPGFYQLFQHAALHPPLCNLSWAVGRDRGSLATSLLLLWWEKWWQKENVHLPSTASCRLWARLFIQQNGLLCSWPSYWRGVFWNACVFPLAFLCARRQHRHANHQCCCCAISNTGEERSSEPLCEGSCTYTQRFRNITGMSVSGKQILPWLICCVELITTFATPPTLLPSPWNFLCCKIHMDLLPLLRMLWRGKAGRGREKIPLLVPKEFVLGEESSV